MTDVVLVLPVLVLGAFLVFSLVSGLRAARFVKKYRDLRESIIVGAQAIAKDTDLQRRRERATQLSRQYQARYRLPETRARVVCEELYRKLSYDALPWVPVKDLTDMELLVMAYEPQFCEPQVWVELSRGSAIDNIGLLRALDAGSGDALEGGPLARTHRDARQLAEELA